MRHSISGTLPLSTGSPRSFGSCPTMMTTPIPLMNPTSDRAGEELGYQRRGVAAPAARSTNPVSIASAASRAAYSKTREGRRHGHEHCRGGDGNRGARPDIELATGAEDRVQHARGERGREPRFGWRARERCVGDSLRHEHRPHGERREQVCAEE